MLSTKYARWIRSEVTERKIGWFKRMKKNRKKKLLNPVKGTSSAFILSVLIHAGLITIAGLIIVITVKPNPPVKWKPPPPITPPKVALEKLKMPVKNPTKPKAAKKITAVLDNLAFSSISFPDLAPGGIGTGASGGEDGIAFIDLPPMEPVSLFGTKESTGNDFEGRVYDFKFFKNGKKTNMYFEEPSTKLYGKGESETAPLVFLRYINQDWDSSVISPYKRSSKLYTSHFCFPGVPSLIMADQFGQRDMQPFNFMVLFKGNLVYPKDITFRFWCTAATAGVIRVGKKDVLARSRLRSIFDFKWKDTKNWITAYYPIADAFMIPGDWITLKAGVPVPMKVALYGRGNNGSVNLVILVEEKGKKYPKRMVGGPLLPIFKTEELTHDMLDQIMKYLPEDEVNLTNGPIFRLF